MQKKHRAKIEKVYARTRDEEAAAKELVSAFYAENSDYLLSPEIYEGIYRQMVRHIAGAMEGKR